MAPLSSGLFQLKSRVRLGTMRPVTMSLELMREHVQATRQEHDSEATSVTGGLVLSERAGGRQESYRTPVGGPSCKLSAGCALNADAFHGNCTRAGSRLKDWKHRVFELDFKTCELRVLSRLGETRRSVGYVERDSDVSAGEPHIIEDSTDPGNNATVYTFELTLQSSGIGAYIMLSHAVQ